MKSLSKLSNETLIERKYHLSYDRTKNFKGSSDDAKIAILRKLKEFGVISIESPCESTIVFTYPDSNFDFDSFEFEIQEQFYFSICLVGRSNNTNKHFEAINYSTEIDDEILQQMWNSID